MNLMFTIYWKSKDSASLPILVGETPNSQTALYVETQLKQRGYEVSIQMSWVNSWDADWPKDRPLFFSQPPQP